ncbi:sterol desaturase family protein [Namhaeicola litoreus]|uniref:Sterol desaturase family protein n=1 Tax=Namhaeicola litoreus TaxID=1052145 RepID=A0ABW3Y4W2_9FLAO
MEPKVTTEHHRGQATIFRNPFLEQFTKTSLKMNVLVYGTVITSLIYFALTKIKIDPETFIFIFLFAIFSWTLAEYILHRYLFHWTSENKYIQRFHFIMHGSHHLYPKDEERLLMPPIPGILMATVLFSIFYILFWLFGFPNLTWAYFPGFFLGYLLYSFLHRATHVNKPPKRFKYLWKHHNLHHYKYPDRAFGVSTTLWDRIFGTMPPLKN